MVSRLHIILPHKANCSSVALRGMWAGARAGAGTCFLWVAAPVVRSYCAQRGYSLPATDHNILWSSSAEGLPCASLPRSTRRPMGEELVKLAQGPASPLCCERVHVHTGERVPVLAPLMNRIFDL
jgi:hypothetical protein